LTKSLNKGLRIAKGEYIARQDADDISAPTRLQKQIKILDENHRIGMVTSCVDIFNDENKEIDTWPADRENTTPEQIYYALFFENCIAHSSVVFRKEIVINLAGYNEQFMKSQDYELWLRLRKNAIIYKITESLVYRRDHPKNTSALVKKVHKDNEENLFLKNIAQVSPKISSKKTLMSIKYNQCHEDKWLDLIKSVYILHFINKSILKSAPEFLDRHKINSCCAIKVKKYIKCYRIGRKIASSYRLFLYLRNKFKMYICNLFNFIEVQRIGFTVNLSKAGPNILLVVPYLVAGGAEKTILNLLKSVGISRYSFHIVTTEKANHIWKEKFEPFCQNIIIPNFRSTNKEYYLDLLSKLIKKLNIETVFISNSIIAYKYLPQLRKTFPDVKFMDIMHVEDSPGCLPKFYRNAKYFDKRICISHYLRKYMEQIYRINGQRHLVDQLITIHNGLDIQKFSPNINKEKNDYKYRTNDEEVIISFVGRFSIEKNPLLFIDIAKQLCDSNINGTHFKFIMVGDGPQLSEIKDKIKICGLERLFILPGMINDVSVLIAETDILLLTSRSEGIPFVLLEALCMNTTFIGTDVGAMREVIIDGKNGILVKRQNDIVREFIKNITFVLSNKSKTDNVDTRNLIVEKFSLDKMGRNYISVFDSLRNYSKRS
jgi:glycosyltransferase involved in cell wall biosynthesis